MSLPIIGKEEDAADSIATVMLIEDTDNLEERQQAAKATINAGIFLFNISGSSNALKWLDTHSVKEQRFFNLACWAIGAEPSILTDTTVKRVSNILVAANRDCKHEYTAQKNSFDGLINQYKK